MPERMLRQNNPLITKIMRSEPLNPAEENVLRGQGEVGFYRVNTPFNEMRSIGWLRDVTFLVLHDVQVSMADIPALFPRVTTLYIAYATATNLPDFSRMAHLIHLQLKAIDGMDFVYESIAALPTLRNLTLKRMPDLFAIPMAKETWYPRLTRLKVSACPKMVEYCEHMYLISSMRTLVIYGSKGDAQHLSGMDTCKLPPNLTTVKFRYLHIPFAPTPDANCFPLGVFALGRLNALVMRHCRVVELPQAVLMLGRTLTVLTAMHCNLRKIPMYFRNMVALRLLILSHNELTNFPYFENCPHLSAVNVADNLIAELDANQFARIGHVKTAMLAFNRLSALPFPLDQYPQQLAHFLLFSIRGNRFPPAVVQFVEAITRLRGHPEELRRMAVPVIRAQPVVQYETAISEHDVDTHVMMLTDDMRELFARTFPGETISPYCAFCLAAFSVSDPPFVCHVHDDEVLLHMATVTGNTVERVKSVIPETDIARSCVSHYNHVLHHSCFSEALHKVFACPEKYLFRFNIKEEEDELVRALKVAKFSALIMPPYIEKDLKDLGMVEEYRKYKMEQRK